MKIIRLIFCCAVLNIIFNNISQAKQISASIYPIASLVKMITEDTADINVLTPIDYDPHHVHFTYKQIQNIKQSKIVFMIDKNLETEIYQYLNKDNTKIFFLSDSNGLKILPLPVPFYKQSNNNTKESNPDLHLWLSPQNAIKMLEYITEILSKEYPENKSLYAKNLKQAKKKITKLDKKIQQNINNININVMFYHGSWQYLTNQYKFINDFGHIASEDHLHNHDITLSAKTMIALKKYITENNIDCIITDTQSPDSKIYLEKILKDQENLRILAANPINFSITQEKLSEDYVLMLENIEKIIYSCSIGK